MVMRRIAIDWDGDLFICYDALPADALNRLHTGLSSDSNFVNLHWGNINSSGINSAAVSIEQEFTAYGIRKLVCATGTNTTAGAYFGRTGSTNDFTVDNGQTYTAVCWVKGDAAVDMLLAMENSSGSQAFTLTTSWQKVTHTFTAADVSTAFKLTKDSDATDVTVEATGFMIVAGSSAPAGFNVGDSSNGYDIITADVRAANWTIGKSHWRELIPAEGVATLTVNNDGRKYSPEYSGSPIYGKMQQKRLITIDLYKPSTGAWVRKFAGWTRQYLPSYGKTRDRLATITCEQGMFRLREARYRKGVAGTATADTIIQSALMDGHVSVLTPLQCPVDSARLNASYLVDPDAIMTLDTGVSEIDLNGEAWGDNDSIAKVIEELMRVERGWFFIAGDGRVRFYNRHHYTDPALTPSAVAFNIDAGAVDGDYRHTEAFYNVVQAAYYPFSLTEGATLWTLRERVVLRPGRSKTVEVRFEREEGKRLEIESVNPFGTAETDSSYTAETVAGVEQTAKMRVEFTQIDGRSGSLFVRNDPGATRRITFLVLRGTVRESYGGQTVEVVSSAGTSGGTYLLKESSRLISTEIEAENLARFLLGMHDSARGEFDSIDLINRDATLLEKQIDNGLGGKITVSEYQTAHSSPYAIVGESHAWEPGTLRTTFTLEPLARRPEVWICGTSALGVDTILAY